MFLDPLVYQVVFLVSNIATRPTPHRSQEVGMWLLLLSRRKRDLEAQSQSLCVGLHLLQSEGLTFQGRIDLILELFMEVFWFSSSSICSKVFRS